VDLVPTKIKKHIIGEDTVCPLHDGLVERFQTVDQKFETVISKLDGLKDQITKQFTAQDEAVASALAASDRAVSKAETASEKRFDSVNEFRSTLADQQRTLMPRSETETLFKNMGEKIETIQTTLIDKITVLEKSLNVGTGQKSGIREGWGYAVGAVGLLLAIVSIIVWITKLA